MAARRTASSAVSVNAERGGGPSSRQGGPDAGQERLPFPPRAQDGLQELAEAAAAAGRVRDHEGLRPHLEGRVGGGGAQAGPGEDGQVVEVVPHVGDLLGAKPLLAQDLLESRSL